MTDTYLSLWGEPEPLPAAALAPVKRGPVTPDDLIREREARLLRERAARRRQTLAGNRLIAQFGPGPDGATCGGCTHLMRKEYHTQEYFKCAMRGVSHGSATDYRLKWAACRLFQPRAPGQEALIAVKTAVRLTCPVCGREHAIKPWYPNREGLLSCGAEPADLARVLREGRDPDAGKRHGLSFTFEPDGTLKECHQAW